MADGPQPGPGRIAWIDLTVDHAVEVRDFYRDVVGWTPSEVPMGDYADFMMHARGGGPAVAGVCHARGPNVGLPVQWLIYITVSDLDESLARCRARGGAVLREPTGMGPHGRYAVIRDPAGAAAALHEPARS